MSSSHNSPAPGRQETPDLEVVGLSKVFGGLKVFQEISFTLSRGELLGMIGPNGAGKTTLINVLSGQLPASAGRIALGGRDVTQLPFHSRAQMGMIRSFQQTNTFREESVRENLSRAMRFSKASPGMEQKLRPLIERFDLSTRLDEPSDKLPYGLQKMLGLLLTYIASPKVLLLDEPAAGLEGRERSRVDDFIHTAQKELDCSVLIVEHDMDMIRRLCTRLLVLDAGKILAHGAPTEVLSRREVIDAYLGVAEEEN
jgi:branched-chain amino acid transport system ATP-binding protein